MTCRVFARNLSASWSCRSATRVRTSAAERWTATGSGTSTSTPATSCSNGSNQSAVLRQRQGREFHPPPQVVPGPAVERVVARRPASRSVVMVPLVSTSHEMPSARNSTRIAAWRRSVSRLYSATPTAVVHLQEVVVPRGDSRPKVPGTSRSISWTTRSCTFARWALVVGVGVEVADREAGSGRGVVVGFQPADLVLGLPGGVHPGVVERRVEPGDELAGGDP